MPVSALTQKMYLLYMNNGKGTISRLMTDEKLANSLDKTMNNLQKKVARD
jgi:hypothetical protein